MTTFLRRATVLIGLVFAFGGIPAAQAAGAGVPRASAAPIGAKTSVPFGWVDFCNRYAPECDEPARPAVDIDLGPVVWKEIEKINRQVNGEIVPTTDMEHWGVVDQWDYPTDGKGDCEDYALQKRKMLIAAGFPRQALLMTVVKNLDGEGHAILTVKTNRGDFVLDNLDDRVRPWADTGYAFIKRQSQEDANVWVSIGAPGAAPLYTAR